MYVNQSTQFVGMLIELVLCYIQVFDMYVVAAKKFYIRDVFFGWNVSTAVEWDLHWMAFIGKALVVDSLLGVNSGFPMKVLQSGWNFSAAFSLSGDISSSEVGVS